MPAGATYDCIATTTLSGSPVTTVSFTSIPQTYTDLVLVSNIIYSANAGDYISLRFNGNTGTNYSTIRVAANGSTVGTGANSNDDKLPFYSASTTQYVPFIAHINNYSNTNVNKTALVKVANATANLDIGVGLFRSTSAITQVDVFFAAANIAASSTFALYGIAAAQPYERT